MLKLKGGKIFLTVLSGTTKLKKFIVIFITVLFTGYINPLNGKTRANFNMNMQGEEKNGARAEPALTRVLSIGSKTSLIL